MLEKIIVAALIALAVGYMVRRAMKKAARPAGAAVPEGAAAGDRPTSRTSAIAGAAGNPDFFKRIQLKMTIALGEGMTHTNHSPKSLRSLKVGQRASIERINAEGELGRRIRDMGLVPGAQVEIVGRAPSRIPWLSA